MKEKTVVVLTEQQLCGFLVAARVESVGEGDPVLYTTMCDRYLVRGKIKDKAMNILTINKKQLSSKT